MKFLRNLVVLIGIAAATLGATITDVSSPKSEVFISAAAPRIRMFDTSGDAFTYLLTANEGRFRIDNQGNTTFLNIPSSGTIGIELTTPTSVNVVPISGGSLTASTSYHIVVTARDGTGGETIASTDETCETTGSNRTCRVTWSAVAAPTTGYRVYMGTAVGSYSSYATVTAPTTQYDATSFPLPNAGSPPPVGSAYYARLSSSGVVFADGTVQSTAGGNSAWQISGTNILNLQTGNLGLGTGSIFTPDAKLTVKCSTGRCFDLNDMGSIITLDEDDLQIRSNYQNSNDTLWDTTVPSWAVAVGNGTAIGFDDAFVIKRAPATAGTPVYAEYMKIDANTEDFTLDPDPSTPLSNFEIQAHTLTYSDDDPNNVITIGFTGGGQPRMQWFHDDGGFLQIGVTDVNNSYITYGNASDPDVFNFNNGLRFTMHIDSTAAIDETNIRVLRNNSNVAPARVSLDSPDTCGSGFRCLRVPN